MVSEERICMYIRIGGDCLQHWAYLQVVLDPKEMGRCLLAEVANEVDCNFTQIPSCVTGLTAIVAFYRTGSIQNLLSTLALNFEYSWKSFWSFRIFVIQMRRNDKMIPDCGGRKRVLKIPDTGVRSLNMVHWKATKESFILHLLWTDYSTTLHLT